MSAPAADLRDLLALHLVPNLGPRRTAALLAHFGSAPAARRASAAQLAQAPLLGPKLADAVARDLAAADPDAELALLERHRTRLLVLGTADYPPPLAEIDDAPHLLCCRGDLADADRE